MVKKLLLAALSGCITLVLLVGLAWMGLNWYGDQPLKAGQENDSLEFVIKPGDSLKGVASRLHDAGWLQYPEAFTLLARLEKAAGGIHAGEYLIPGNISPRELLNIFVTGQVRYFDVTLVEGQTIREALAALNQHEKLSEPLSPEQFQALLKELDIAEHPEGLFYPDTYFFQSGSSVRSILKRAKVRLDEVLAEEWAKREKNLPYNSSYEALIMASLVEKETGAEFERPEIAGVFVRRMKKGMRLQTDPTVIYGLGKDYQGNLTRRMLRKPSPYNTYVIKGLPPTPIALAGREAIQAALNPKEGDTYYFVAKGDGTHYFSKTLAEHNRAVRKYQILERRDDYRSTVE